MFSLSSSVKLGDTPDSSVEITVVLMLSESQDVVACQGHPRNNFTTPILRYDTLGAATLGSMQTHVVCECTNSRVSAEAFPRLISPYIIGPIRQAESGAVTRGWAWPRVKDDAVGQMRLV